MALVEEIEQLAHAYRRKGGKRNRSQQVGRMLKFGASAGKTGARHMAQVGTSHVILFWKANRDLSDATLKSYWLALRTLWRLSEKHGEPPEPFYKAKRLTPLVVSAKPFFERLDD
jgi:hypothetical protein